MEEVEREYRIPDEAQNQENHSETNDTAPRIMLPWIPSISPKLRKVFRKAGYKFQFKANPNLQAILTK